MELIKLDIFNRKASLGMEYFELNKYYPNWSNELHSFGNIMDNEQLEYIAVYGIIHWYHTKNVNFDICYYFYNNLQMFKNNPKTMTFYDMIELNKLADFANIPKIYNIKSKSKHMEYLINDDKSIFIKYANLPWIEYIESIIDINKIEEFINKLYNYINYNIEWFGTSCWLNVFLDKYPDIKKMGIIFQKFKILLEKIHKNPDIYKLDIFVEMIQSSIYSLCKYYYDNFKNSNNNIIKIKNIEWIDNPEYYKPILYNNFNYKLFFN